MKKILILSLLALILGVNSTNASAQKRFKISNDITLVSSGDAFWIEDDRTQMSISISVAQDVIDRRNGQKFYRVVCEGATKTVVKLGVKEAVKAGVKAAAPSGGSSLWISAAGKVADIVYDELCDYWGEDFE